MARVNIITLNLTDIRQGGSELMRLILVLSPLFKKKTLPGDYFSEIVHLTVK